MRDALGNQTVPGAIPLSVPLNPSPVATAKLQQIMAQRAAARPNPAVTPGTPALSGPVNPLARQQLGVQPVPPPPAIKPLAQPVITNPALQAQRQAMPKGFGTVIRQ
jgi:hypothetical protein